ncbi:MAG: tetratricopeptide repeat protein [Verrucomicrobiota bacterium]
MMKSSLPATLLAFLTVWACQAEEKSFASYVMEGYEQEAADNYGQAVEAYSQALALTEDSPVALVRRAYCHVQLKNFEAAAEDLKLASVATPVTMTDYQTLAWLKATSSFVVIRDAVIAVTYAQKAHTEDPTAASYDILAAAYAEMGSFQKAANLLKAGLKKFPDSDRAPGMKSRLALYAERKPFRDAWLEDDTKELKEFERTIRRAQ